MSGNPCNTCREGLSGETHPLYKPHCITCDELQQITGCTERLNAIVMTMAIEREPEVMEAHGIELPPERMKHMEDLAALIILRNQEIISLSQRQMEHSQERIEDVHRRLILTVLNANHNLLQVKNLWKEILDEVDDEILWIHDLEDRMEVREAWKVETDRIEAAIDEMDVVYGELAECLDL
ncbi:hypothetical protein PSEUBRA_001098 [Kalmanozyma brasiliensis GHG001]|uniref:uncharacterized protein n=1 Tax=Kalmanozyma brasiliensis (strain GHG001) TaxID=1365824 RepID=UPI00286837A7|nr:uncharacterized protein PSEUBRA_001098 [Kalmanozyma brasiliensis GHG001]KAF6766890.1 hypothetical protein PSEUBRA_001098 [Kalmanozyma brasiliensis GHG001]